MLTKQKIVNRKRRAPPDYDASLLMRLPPEIHAMLFLHLNEVDRICLLLTCKYFTRVGCTTNTQQHSLSVGAGLLRISQGFSYRLPKRLKACAKCGIMRPKDPSYWEPYRCGWDWRKLIPTKEHRKFANQVHAWNTGRGRKCPRCFGAFLAQGNLDVGDIPFYGKPREVRKYEERFCQIR
jgi:hypothetical protein